MIEPAALIVLTGGPCSGKSSSLAYLTERLSDHGFMVFTLPETATIISNSGIDRRRMDKPLQVVMYEEAIFDLQLAFEETYRHAANSIFPGRRKVIILDRGIMDIKAFMPEDDFKSILKRKGHKEAGLRDRYTGVIHLITAAEGAPDYYTGENNAARIETPEQAITIDQKIRKSWLGHPHFKVIDNSTDFQEKINRAFVAISQILGIPVSPARRERLLVSHVDYSLLPPHQVIQMEQVFLRLRDRNEEVQIRKRGNDGGFLYFLERRRRGAGQRERVAEEEMITEQQYLSLKGLMDPRTGPVYKERICFLWNNRYYELDQYNGSHEGLMVLEVEASEDAGGLQIPPFIETDRPIGHDPRYSDKTLARTEKADRASTEK